jgi:hypothetical protein
MNASQLVDVRHGGWFPHGRTDRIVRTPIIDGHHPGCVERRREYAPVGQFDGKPLMTTDDDDIRVPP